MSILHLMLTPKPNYQSNPNYQSKPTYQKDDFFADLYEFYRRKAEEERKKAEMEKKAEMDSISLEDFFNKILEVKEFPSTYRDIDESERNNFAKYIDLKSLIEKVRKEEQEKKEAAIKNKRKVIMEEFERFLNNYIDFDYQWDEQKALDEIKEIEFEIKNKKWDETEFSLSWNDETEIQDEEKEERNADNSFFQDGDIVDVTFERYGKGTKLKGKELIDFLYESICRVVFGKENWKEQNKYNSWKDDLFKNRTLKR